MVKTISKKEWKFDEKIKTGNININMESSHSGKSSPVFVHIAFAENFQIPVKCEPQSLHW